MSRNKEWEHEFLDKISREGDREKADRFLRGVRARMEKGAEEYGDLSYKLPFPRVIQEAREEGEDWPGWLSIAVHALRRDESLPKPAADHLEDMLVAASAKVFAAWQILELAAEFYEDSKIPPPPPEPVSCVGSM